MPPRPHRRLTDPNYLLRYALEHPRRAVRYALLAAVVLAVVTVALALDAVPVWVGLVVAGPALMAVATESIQRARLVLAASEGSTGAVTDGVVSVSGSVVAPSDRRLTAECQQRDCLAYEYARTRGSGGQENTKSTRITQKVLPFYVDDGSGPVLVDATTGTLSLRLVDQGRREREGVVCEGDRVTVYGEVADRGPGETPDGTDPERVVTTGSRYNDVLVTDRSGRRIVLRQGGYALGWIGVGLVSVLAGGAMAVGLFPF